MKPKTENLLLPLADEKKEKNCRKHKKIHRKQRSPAAYLVLAVVALFFSRKFFPFVQRVIAHECVYVHGYHHKY